MKWKLIGLLVLVGCFTKIYAQDRPHGEIPKRALAEIYGECGQDWHGDLKEIFFNGSHVDLDIPIWNGLSFTEISLQHTGVQISKARNHKAKTTVLNQLKDLTASKIKKSWQRVQASTKMVDLEGMGLNVLANYTLHHLMAIRLADEAARRSSERTALLQRMLAYEARAMSYLIDAFSSAQMLLDFKLFAGIQKTNYQELQKQFSKNGLYVYNSKGQVWQCFGGELMLTHEPTYRFVLEAGSISIKEALLAYHEALAEEVTPECLSEILDTSIANHAPVHWQNFRNGDVYYSEYRMPSLLGLPAPVHATWSKQSDRVDEYGISLRIQKPQLKEKGFHNPMDHRIDTKLLPKKDAVPPFLVFDEFNPKPNTDSLRKLIKYHPAFASVKYIQSWSYVPSYKGWLWHLGGGALFQNGDFSLSTGIGYGLVNNLIALKNISIDLDYTHLNRIDDKNVLSLYLGAELPIPIQGFSGLRLEFGKAHSIGDPFHIKDRSFAAGISFRSIDLGFTLAAVNPRIMFRKYSLNGFSQSGVYLQLVFH